MAHSAVRLSFIAALLLAETPWVVAWRSDDQRGDRRDRARLKFLHLQPVQ
jgi:hypothetical protein